ncbi:DUF533 domain-containing protein [Cocleimonas sp. KMM 6892]|uniref:tellurite resistance TerB family protein n=1 Tax=unclassified Cocleimonas TaxID=2639732 RepID=UPI002DB9B99B|nr:MULTISPECIES: DUF533 domain-containing protein [unclassified Cocleimonas]MEB8432940.1 DUF533 domain-containing protein [Cocleimonas sp. KMM 6892]MEC4716079.1 DUF533 domain-containing protein [Cocleimonas sp. KMM 6895]MEC4745540.1 DUF533 domain-containing protein [Cocleimonas sp. KMM 6896]
MDAIDTIKILGSLLGNGALSKGSGGNVLGSILGSALGGAQNQQTQGGGALGDILGGLIGGNQRTTSGGGMADILGGLLGGQQQQQQGGGLGDLLGSLTGGGQSGGGLGDLLGSLAGSRQQQAPQSGGMGDLLGGLLGGGQSGGMGGAGGLGGLLGGALTKYAQNQNSTAPNPGVDDSDLLPMGIDQREATDQATLIIRTMINAAKSDGSIDEAEQEKVINKLGDVTQAEADFVRNEFRQPLDAAAFVRSIPRGMEQQIYAVSLMAIDLDHNKEAKYLDELARGLNIQPQLANQIHEQLGAPKLYA